MQQYCQKYVSIIRFSVASFDAAANRFHICGRCFSKPLLCRWYEWNSNQWGILFMKKGEQGLAPPEILNHVIFDTNHYHLSYLLI